MGSGSCPGSFRTRSTFATRSIPFLAPERDAAATENPTLIAKTSADDFAAQARLAPLGGAPVAASTASWESVTRWLASASSTCGATHTDTSLTGASRTEYTSSATWSTTCTSGPEFPASTSRRVPYHRPCGELPLGPQAPPARLRSGARSGGHDADHAITEAPPRCRGSDPNRGHCRRGADALRSGRLTTAGRLTSGPPGPHLQSLIA